MRSLGKDPLLHVVSRIYQGATDPRAWPGIVEALATILKAPKGRLFTLLVPPEKGGLHFSHGVSEAAFQQWAAHYIQHDLWALAGVAKGALKEGNVVFGEELVPEEEFLQSVIYREHLRQLDVARMCSGIVFDRHSPGVLPTVFSVFRGFRDARFGQRERATMVTLLPHLSRSLGVMFRLRDAELRSAASVAALDRLACGVILLAADGRVAHVNRSAERAISMDDGFAGCQAGKALATNDEKANVQLASAVAAVLDRDALLAPHFSAAVIVPRPSGARPFVLQFAPLAETNDFAREAGSVAAIVFVTEQDRAISLDRAMLRRLYQLTDAEIRLAERLCAGDTLESAAVTLGIAVSTAKSELGGLFQKTDTHRQAELVRLLVPLGSDRL